MKEFFSFALLLTTFALSSIGLHWLVKIFDLSGLAAFMVFCLPLIAVISFTTMADSANFGIALFRNVFWAYSFILALASVAWVIGKY